MRNFHAIPKSLQVGVAGKCSISRHYRTFIQKPANSGVQCVLACESVTAAYLNTNQDRRTKILPTQTRPKAFRARRLQRIVPMANARKILIVEDDTDLRDTLVEQVSLHDEFEAKPFRFAVLLARIRAQLRQHEASEDAVFSVGPYSFRPGSKMLTGANARKVRLTEKETAILRFLYRAGQLPVSRETLLQEVWGYNSGVTTHTLETHIYRLRQKIEKDAANPEILVTEAGGYKLVP